MIITKEFELANKIVQLTNRNLFLTGKAGTGKTTFLKNLKEHCPKRMVVLAPTGVAAINAGGMTIHSFFQISPGLFLPSAVKKKKEVFQMRKEKINIIKTLDLLVIDEISMVRADLLDEVDATLRRIRGFNVPFGGVQLLMIGDLQQLAPVVRDEEWQLLQDYYPTPYFFDSVALKSSSFSCIELKKVFRQTDQHFVDLLNKIREGKVDQETLKELNSHYHANFHPAEGEGYIHLTTHNSVAQNINESQLSKINNNIKTFEATVTGIFPEANYPTEQTLVLKVGAQVMFIRNDQSPEKRYFNGKIGTVKAFDSYTIVVSDKDNPDSDIFVSTEKWDNVKYTLNPETNEIEEQVEGSFEQFPLRLAWAITIHKSQGLTFDRAIIDAQSSFSHGQVYVALSRCRTLEGMILSSPLRMDSIKYDKRVEQFCDTMENEQADGANLKDYMRNYFLSLAQEFISFYDLDHIVYQAFTFLRINFMSKYPKLENLISKSMPTIKEKIVDVANKFATQLSQICKQNPDNYEELVNERITKCIPYFSQNLQTLVLPILENFQSIDTDNKEVKRKLTDVQSRFHTAYYLKFKLFSTILNKETGKAEFNTKTYLRTKTDFLINNNKEEKSEKKSKSSSQKIVSQGLLDMEHIDLFRRLQAWRKEKADEIKKPAYCVLNTTVLTDISNYLPTEEEELKKIKGMGDDKMKNFAADLLTIVDECITQYGYHKNKETFTEKPSKEKKQKVDTHQVTYELFQEGKTIPQIAEMRGLSVITIESHIVKLILSDRLPLSVLSTEKRIKALQKYMDEHPGNDLKPIFEAFDGKYAYAEIKLAQQYKRE